VKLNYLASYLHCPATRYEREVRSAIPESRACGIDLLEPRQFIEKLMTACQTEGIPSRVGHEPAMKQVEPAKFVDLEAVRKITA
jgi:hypothetical protein